MGSPLPPTNGTEPRVTMIIVAQSGLEKTRSCLESIFAMAEASITSEIIVVENATMDGTRDYLDSLGILVRIIHNSAIKSYSQNNNFAAKEARGKYLCLLRDDTTVTKDWLKKLFIIIEKNPTIGVVGNRHIDPQSGKITHAGMALTSEGKPWPLYHRRPADFWPALIDQEFQIVKGTCLLVRKQLFLELGGFDTDFEDGCYEDMDLCLRVRQRGYKCFYAAESVIYHPRSPISNPTTQEERNWELFQFKWGPSILPDIDSFYVPPEPDPEPAQVDLTSQMAEEEPAIKKLSHIEERYRHVEALHARHPMIASVLRSIIRFATSTAKLLNRGAK